MYPYFFHPHIPIIQNTCEPSLVDWLTAFGTIGAAIVALFIPFVVILINNLPKKSNLKVIGTSVINQDTAENEIEENSRRILNVGRLIIKNKGKFKAAAVEVSIEKIIFEEKEREDFVPVPLTWTHGHLNKDGSIHRGIYKNQTVYLDIFNHIYDNNYVHEM